MASQTEIRSLRIAKKEALEKEGMDSYPISSRVTNTIKETIADFTKLSKKKSGIILAGRIMSLRPQGKLAFLNIFDGTGLFQVLLKKDEIEEKSFDLFVETIDIGDIVEFKGSLFVTKRKEKTILAKEWTMLSKSLRPLPEKWHGLKDVEERYRRRYLDSLMSQEVRERFYLRSKIITEIRSFLDKNDFLEVETPALQPFAGGASAKPFVTHHNALDTDLYLRIAVELYLKRMIVGGFPRVYEIGRNFRNEGIDATHNPEFTMIEWYQSFSDAKEQMVFVEKLFKLLVKNIYKKKSITFGEQEIDFSKKFAVVPYFDLLKRYALIVNPETMEKKELVLKARQLGVDVKQSDSIEKIFDSIYKKTCRPKIIQPTFIVDYPVHYLPLAKRKKENKNLVDAFQLVVGGIELVKGFSELNDPLDQRERFLEQEKDRQMGDDEAQGLDEEFIEALEYGMPPTGGVGVGIDRLVMLFADVSNIREVIYFPTLRPKE